MAGARAAIIRDDCRGGAASLSLRTSSSPVAIVASLVRGHIRAPPDVTPGFVDEHQPLRVEQLPERCEVVAKCFCLRT